MDYEKVVENLKGMLGAEKIVTDGAVLDDYRSDLIGYRRWERYSKNYRTPRPVCVIKAGSTEDVSQVLKYMNEVKMNVIPVSGRSCVTGGIECTDNTVMLDISDMNGVLAFDTTNYTVTVKGGTPLEYLEGYCNLRGYTTGHFPQSLPLAQMAGLVATRSIGQLSTLYGGIEELLIGLEAVLPTGEVVRIKNVPRRSAGIDLRHLFMGSEGRFGVITEVTVKIFRQPEGKWQCAFGMPSMDDGLEALREIMQAGWKPAVARLHDAYEAEETYPAYVQPGESILFFVAYGPKGVETLTGDAITEICLSHGGRVIGSKPVDHWFEVRNNVCYALDRHYKAGNVGDSIEVSANWSDIGEIYKAACARGMEEVDDVVQFSAHSSHSYVQGTNMYFVTRFKGSDNLEQNEKRFLQVYTAIMEETLKRGGSICHHHGVGKYRTRWIEQEHGSAYQLLGKVRDALDPNGIMNKGTLINDG
jgi:alkyldihydroxyacetonephosphate synthase